MIQIHSTGRPIAATAVRVGDTIMVNNSAITVTAIDMLPHDYREIIGRNVFGHWAGIFKTNEIVNLAEEESLDNLKNKGAI